MKRILVSGMALYCALIGLTAQAAADLRLYGSNTVGAELAPELVKAWLRDKGYTQFSKRQQGNYMSELLAEDPRGKQITVALATEGSSTGFRALKEGVADIAMASRSIKQTEAQQLKPLGNCSQAPCEHVVGLDGISVIVNPANPVSSLSKRQLQAVFSGEITNWSQLGGTPGEIDLYALDENSGTFDTFKSLVLGKKRALAATASRYASHERIAAHVARETDAIGFVGLSFVGQTKPLAVSDGEAVAIKPGPFAVATEDYVLARRLFMYLPEQRSSKLAEEFIAFAESPKGQSVVDEVGFIAQSVLTGHIPMREGMPKEYHDLAAEAERLSLNFRFQKGSVSLDTKAQRDIERLQEFMKQPKMRNRQLMLFGFADSNELMPIRSLQLSVERADRVADLLIQAGLEPRRVRGFGNAVPVASNETAQGRLKNRRVEVWIK